MISKKLLHFQEELKNKNGKHYLRLQGNSPIQQDGQKELETLQPSSNHSPVLAPYSEKSTHTRPLDQGAVYWRPSPSDQWCPSSLLHHPKPTPNNGWGSTTPRNPIGQTEVPSECLNRQDDKRPQVRGMSVLAWIRWPPQTTRMSLQPWSYPTLLPMQLLQTGRWGYTAQWWETLRERMWQEAQLLLLVNRNSGNRARCSQSNRHRPHGIFSTRSYDQKEIRPWTRRSEGTPMGHQMG